MANEFEGTIVIYFNKLSDFILPDFDYGTWILSYEDYLIDQVYTQKYVFHGNMQYYEEFKSYMVNFFEDLRNDKIITHYEIKNED